MSDQHPAPGDHPPDHFGRRLLTAVGVVVSSYGLAHLRFSNDTFAVATGVSLLLLGLGLVIMAAFFGDVGGNFHSNRFEMWFGRGRRNPAEVDATDQAKTAPDGGPPASTPVVKVDPKSADGPEVKPASSAEREAS
jgi:hypothetical protein